MRMASLGVVKQEESVGTMENTCVSEEGNSQPVSHRLQCGNVSPGFPELLIFSETPEIWIFM